MPTTVPSTEFQTRTGQYLDESGKAPVFITRHSRPVRVLIDIEEYERLKACDTRRAWYTSELSDEWRTALETANGSHIDPDLDTLMN